jgi:RNA polymerase sigma-70 factor, ECF subfamily
MTCVQEQPLTAKPAAGELDVQFEQHRRELIAYCYRMLASPFEAEDAVQETFLRAWRAYDRFEGRAALRSWLYRIATNVCLDMLNARERRARPMDLGPAREPIAENLHTLPEITWIQPIPDPAEEAVARETIRLAFVAALQHLPPRQRAVLILRDALGWSAGETASLVDTSVAAVNSALQRARGTLKTHLPGGQLDWAPTADPDEDERSLLRRYVDAWERADVNALVALLREDVRLTMPPLSTWFDGRDAVGEFLARRPLAEGASEHRRVPTRANRQPAFGVYLRRQGDSAFRPFAIEVLRIQDGLVAEIHYFIFPRLFSSFGLPPQP